ncbi:hypothetical protein M433DRAFT_9100 [Acidomyces richmondensis BFW]|nr:hypothetical protein M433DRAFT_9100 [Acidomyces richmondensis BFW]
MNYASHELGIGLRRITTVVESDGLSVLRPGESAPKRREESNGNQDRDED